MKSRMRLASLALAALLGCIAALLFWSHQRQRPERPRPAPAAPVKRPNVVLISLDTVRPDHLGCYGYGRNTSPNLDALARESVLFKNACAQAPWTLPSHMSLFTSMLPSHNRVEDLNERLADDIPTLAELMRAGGYNTAALVNNGQMMAHWGFSRGFDAWREFEADTPAGTCENITREALAWLGARPREPFFLFLHYFDAHDPYDAPPKYREAFGSSLSGEEARAIVWEHREPGKDIADARLLKEIVGAYDAEIAWLDAELGKLLRALPPETLIVVFSDHGEAFEEHGWMTHGATLYEEEVRTALIVRAPGVQARAVETPVMLLDVAPTVLHLCGLKVPQNHEGGDLRPLLKGKGSIANRPILSETKRHLEGRVLKMCARPPWKLIYSLFDARVELYKLPDEHTDMAQTETVRAEEMLSIVRELMAGEDYWMLYAKGDATCEAALKAQGGRFAVFIPVGFDPERDEFRPSPDGTELSLRLRQGAGVRGLYFELSSRDAAVSFDLKLDGERRREMVFIGGQANPDAVPFELKDLQHTLPPFNEKPFDPERNGWHVMRHAGRAAGRSAEGVKLDEDTIKRLRSLGYVR